MKNRLQQLRALAHNIDTSEGVVPELADARHLIDQLISKVEESEQRSVMTVL